MKRFHRLAQRGAEAFGRGEKTDKLTAKLAEIEKRVEGIRNGCLITIKKLSATFVGSGATLEKHQKKIPQYSLGISMMESGANLKESQSLFGEVLDMVGQAQMDIAAEMSQYEISVMHDIIQELNTMLDEDCKKVDKAKKKLSNARLDMDAARTKLKGYEANLEKHTREYNMEKLGNMRQDVEECTKVFDDAQDQYAAEMYDFLSKEQLYTKKIQELVLSQIKHYKTAANQLEAMLPQFEKKMNSSQMRPVFGASLTDHLSNSKQEIATVLDVCCTALREHSMDTEGLFRIAASSSKVKFLKSAFDAGQTDVSAHDPHTIAGCLKMYLRELPEPLLTYELYSDWMKAAGHADFDKRLQEIWTVKERLPAANLANLRYLMCFLHEFSLYSEVTKMTCTNIAIVIGPNLLWPREENADPLNMVTDTAIQRRIAEVLIEQCHWMFPGLPEPTTPSLPNSSLTPTNSFSSSHSISPLSPRGSAEPTSISSSSSTGSPAPTPRTRERPPERELPHPLADNAALEGIPVQMVESKNSSAESTPPPGTPSPKTKKVPPPVAPYKPGHTPLTSHKSDPPSPVPKPRTTPGSHPVPIARTPSGDVPTENGEHTSDYTPSNRPVPATRPKPPPTASKPSPTSKPTPTKTGTLGRGPSRRAPPPPVSKKPAPSPAAVANQVDDEMSAL